jgi:hypothetical protein
VTKFEVMKSSKEKMNASNPPARIAFGGATNLFIFLPMSTPEIVLGASLLVLFLNLQIATGFLTIVIAHIMFNISYVVVNVIGTAIFVVALGLMLLNILVQRRRDMGGNR